MKKPNNWNISTPPPHPTPPHPSTPPQANWGEEPWYQVKYNKD